MRGAHLALIVSAGIFAIAIALDSRSTDTRSLSIDSGDRIFGSIAAEGIDPKSKAMVENLCKDPSIVSALLVNPIGPETVAACGNTSLPRFTGDIDLECVTYGETVVCPVVSKALYLLAIEYYQQGDLAATEKARNEISRSLFQ
jgi:hypothetical protein